MPSISEIRKALRAERQPLLLQRTIVPRSAVSWNFITREDVITGVYFSLDENMDVDCVMPKRDVDGELERAKIDTMEPSIYLSWGITHKIWSLDPGRETNEASRRYDEAAALEVAKAYLEGMTKGRRHNATIGWRFFDPPGGGTPRTEFVLGHNTRSMVHDSKLTTIIENARQQKQSAKTIERLVAGAILDGLPKVAGKSQATIISRAYKLARAYLKDTRQIL